MFIPGGQNEPLQKLYSFPIRKERKKTLLLSKTYDRKNHRINTGPVSLLFSGKREIIMPW